MIETAEGFLAHFPRVRQNGPGDWHVPCSGHDDSLNDPAKFSLHVTLAGDRILITCFAGCPRERVLAALGLTDADLFLRRTNGATRGAPEPVPTLAAFAAIKRIPQAVLEAEGWRQDTEGLVIPYRQRDETTWRLRHRSSLRPGAGFRWDGQKDRVLIPFGRHHLDEWMERGDLILVEGESDAVTAWLHGLPCLGIPGNLASKALTLEDLVGIEMLSIIREPGQSGDGFVAKLRDRLQQVEWTGTARVLRLPAKDLSDLHVADPACFLAAVKAARATAVSLVEATTPGPEPAGQSADPAPQIRTLTWSDMIAGPRRPVTYLWPGWVPLAAVALLVGAGDRFKGWLLLVLAVFTAAGRAPLVTQENDEAARIRSGPVLYITAENSIEEEKRRCQLLQDGVGLPAELPITFVPAETLSLGRDADYAQVVALVERIHPVVLCIDSAIALSDVKQENDNSEVRRFMRDRILPLSRKHGATVFLIGHSPKAPSQPGQRFTDEHVARGAADWRNASDVVLYLKRDATLGPQAVVLKHAKVRVGPRHAPIWFSLEDVPGSQAVRVVYGGTYAEDTGQAAAAGLMKAILSAVDALKASPSGAYTKSLEPQLIGPGISKATARRALDVVRGKKPWPAGSLAGKTQPIVTEDRHGRAVFLVLDVAQAEQIGLGDQESSDE